MPPCLLPCTQLYDIQRRYARCNAKTRTRQFWTHARSAVITGNLMLITIMYTRNSVTYDTSAKTASILMHPEVFTEGLLVKEQDVFVSSDTIFDTISWPSMGILQCVLNLKMVYFTLQSYWNFRRAIRRNQQSTKIDGR